MTQVFQEDGTMVAVSVLAIEPNTVTRLRTPERDGYAAVQLGSEVLKRGKLSKPVAGQLKDLPQLGTLREFRVDDLGAYEVGQQVALGDVFADGDLVDVTGVSKGKGFAGVIKRHHFSSNRASHGNSLSHNSPGSIGMAQDPGRVFPGKRMAGHLGDVNRTVQLLEVVRVDAERSLIMIKGSVPGAKNGKVILHPSVKAKAPKGGK